MQKNYLQKVDGAILPPTDQQNRQSLFIPQIVMERAYGESMRLLQEGSARLRAKYESESEEREASLSRDQRRIRALKARFFVCNQRQIRQQRAALEALGFKDCEATVLFQPESG